MISVITRTKDRAFFLPRVFHSLLKQTYRPIEWIVVNDAGEDINELLEDFKTKTDENFIIKYINKKNSTTMEAATNEGLKNATGTFINILDDDDTIEDFFYTDSITYLETESLKSIKGVISYSKYIYEEISNKKKIQILREEAFPNKPLCLTLATILYSNQFPIHSFIYYRDVLTTIGNYDEEFPVLGDWEFNIRFIEKYDIGIIPKVSVNYHRREDTHYGNTNITQLSNHQKYDAVIRNKIMRAYKETPNLSILMSQSSTLGILSTQINSLHKIVLKNSDDIIKKDKKIEEFHKDIIYRNEVINNKNKIISELSLVAEKKDKLIETKDADIVYRDEVIQNKNKIIEEKQHTVDTKKEQIFKQHSDITFRDTVIQNKNKIIKEKNEAVVYRDKVIQNKNKIIEENTKELKKNNSIIRNKNSVIDALQTELTTIYTGRSWKMTKLLRRLKRVLK